MIRYYKLNGRAVVACEGDRATLGWAQWLEASGVERIVAQTETTNGAVSTVFMGLDHNFTGKGPPLVFETMVFGGTKAHHCEHCSTWEEALAQHERVLAMLVERKET